MDLSKNQWMLLAQVIIMLGGLFFSYLSYTSSNASKEFYEKTIDFYNEYEAKMNETTSMQSLQFLLSQTKADIEHLKTINVSNEKIANLETEYAKASNLAIEAISFKTLGNETGYEEKITESSKIILNISKDIATTETTITIPSVEISMITTAWMIGMLLVLIFVGLLTFRYIIRNLS